MIREVIKAAIPCPACGIKLTSRASHSRFVDLYVCSDCGVKEAFEGFFWIKRYHADKPTQPAGFDPYKLGPKRKVL